MAAQDTTHAPGTALRQHEMWEVDFDKPERGVHRVQATLYYAPHDADDAMYHDLLVAAGVSDELIDYQWETERGTDINCIYPARADGSFVSDRDGATRIFASRDEAVHAAIEALQQRIVKAQDAITRMSGKEAR